MTDEDLAALNEEIAAMARAGLPLDQGLTAMAGEMGKGTLRRVTLALAEDLRAGHPLPEALARQKGRVPAFYASLVAAGIRTGSIPDVLATLTLYARTLAGVRSTVREALYYPGTVLLLAMALLGALGFTILPQFSELFREFELPLPESTQFILSVFEAPMRYLVGPLLFVVAAIAVVRWQLRRTLEGTCLWARCLYAVPIVGTLIHAARLAAFTELLAILVDHSLPLPEAFLLAGAASSDPLMASTAQAVHNELNQGLSLAETLRGRGLVPEWVSWLAGMGEKRGMLGLSLHQIAEVYRRQVEMRAALLRNVLPPFLIIATAGAFVGTFVFVVMRPMYTLLGGLSK